MKTFRTSTPNNKNSDTSWIYQTTPLDPDEEDENFGMRPPQKPVLHLANVGAKTPVSRASVLVFEDPKSKALMDHIKLVAPSDANALIIGETGTGKEIIARHVHNLSNRSKKPFVAVNCGAFSENLIESELFGHECGAFTGASAAKAGWFETANGGTLFLDEIGELPIALQVKLLRVLQERQVVRLGSRKPVEIDVRFIAATNVQLEDAVTAGRFREDYIIASKSRRWKFPHSANDRMTFCRSPAISSRSTPNDSASKIRHLIQQRKLPSSPVTRGQEISASWKTSSITPCSSAVVALSARMISILKRYVLVPRNT